MQMRNESTSARALYDIASAKAAEQGAQVASCCLSQSWCFHDLNFHLKIGVTMRMDLTSALVLPCMVTYPRTIIAMRGATSVKSSNSPRSDALCAIPCIMTSGATH